MSSGVQEMQWGRLLEAAQTMMEFAVAMGAARPVCGLSVKDLLEEFRVAKERTGRSPRYLRQVGVSTRRVFGKELSKPLAEVTTRDVECALAALGVSARTVRGYMIDVRTLFNYALRRRYLVSNPLAVIEPPRVNAPPPQIHTPEQVRRVLAAARTMDLDFCRALAIRYFAGLRSAEVFRLSEEEIKGDYIEVTAAKSKTRRRRLVEITPNLRAWLAIGGSLPVGRTSGRAKRIAVKAKCDWPANVTRHSFCTYHLAKFGSAGRTALEAGHTEAVLFAHYREIVTREAAGDFFGILPGEEVNADD